MRPLLLGLLPIACTVSTAAPSERAPDAHAPRPVRAAPQAPIIENGQGCGAQIAGGGARAKRARASMPGGPASAAVSAAEGRASADVAAPPPPPPPAPPAAAAPSKAGERAVAAPRAQHGGGVRAGEWDDNANYRDYLGWLGAAGRSAARIDAGGRQFIVVTDRDGKAMPSCQVAIQGARGRAQLTTTSAGRALVFPGALGLGELVAATASCGGAAAVTAPISARAVDGVTHLKLALARQLPARRAIDLAFVLDTTGSMSEEIDAVKATVRAVAGQLGAAQTDVRVGLVEYKDRTDCILTQTFPFSSDLTAFSAQVAGLAADGGGDTPEDMHAGLAAALDKLQWRGDAVARLVVVIADAPPHLDYQGQRDYADAARRAAARGIKLYTVSASGMDDTGQVVMRQLAQHTGGSNLFVLRGGAGPQSVGGGDPKSACGGTHTEYSSGNLDQLIVRKVRTELAALDADPLLIPGRGGDENAKPCAQRLVLAN